MRHAVFEGKSKKFRHRPGDPRITLAVGMLVMLWGILGALWGCTIVSDNAYHRQQWACAISLVGGGYMLLTGLWFATRNGINRRRLFGLMVMVLSVQIGTWVGIYLLAGKRDGDFVDVHIAFYAGLAAHLAGVLSVRKE